MPQKLSTATNETALPLELCYQLLTGTSAQVVLGGKTPTSKTCRRKADLTVFSNQRLFNFAVTNVLLYDSFGKIAGSLCGLSLLSTKQKRGALAMTSTPRSKK